MSPQAKREAVAAMMRDSTTISERRACLLAGLSRTVLHYMARTQAANVSLQKRIVELAWVRRRFCYRRIHLLLQREGTLANHKRVYRLYRKADLAVRRRRRRRGVAVEREPLVLPQQPNVVWSMDFVSDALANGRRLKALTIVDDCTKESVDIVVDHGISGHYVTRVLDQVVRFRGAPRAIRTDQGPEFTSKALDQWAYRNGVKLKLIAPAQNAFIESFNWKFRDECLNEHWFESLAQARTLIAAWRQDYNEQRPHSSLGNRFVSGICGRFSVAPSMLSG